VDTPWWASAAFWGGIVLGGVLSYAMSILANLSQSKVVSYLDSRKLVSHEKKQSKALDLHRVICDLHAGRRDRYAYMLRMISGANISFLMSTVSLAGVGVILALVPEVDAPEYTLARLKPLGISMILLLVSSLGLYTFIYTIERFRYVTNALEGFEKYRAKFICPARARAHAGTAPSGVLAAMARASQAAGSPRSR